MKTVAGVQLAAGHPFTLPTSVDRSTVIGGYHNGTNYVLLEASDAIQPVLPAAVTSAPPFRTVPGGDLKDVPGRVVPLIGQVTGTPFTITRNMLGINIGLTWRTLDMRRVGFVRPMDAHVRWSDVETVAGVYLPSAVAELDAMVNAATAAGAEFVYVVDHPPTVRSRQAGVARWLPGTPGAPGAISYASLTAYVNWLLGRYGNKITAIESWNEPVVTTAYLDSAGAAGVVAFHNALHAAVTAWNSANSGTVKVVSITNTGWDGLGAAVTHANPALEAVGGFANCDVLGYHIYWGGGSYPFSHPDAFNLVRPLLAWRNATASVAGKEIWITEHGDSNIAKMNTTAWWCRVFLYWFALGVKRIAPYSWDNEGLGNMRVDQVPDAYLSAVAFLTGKQVSYVNAIQGGVQIAARLDGVDYLF